MFQIQASQDRLEYSATAKVKMCSYFLINPQTTIIIDSSEMKGIAYNVAKLIQGCGKCSLCG